MTTAAPWTPLLDSTPGWTHHRHGELTLWWAGAELRRDPATLAAELVALGGTQAPDPDRLTAWLAGLDGFFALVAQGPGWLLAAVDRVRSRPLLWAEAQGHFWLSQEGPPLAERLGLGPGDADPDQVIAFALAGYTVGEATLYPAIRALTPGQALLLDAGPEGRVTARPLTHHRWRPFAPDAVDPDDLRRPLAEVHERLIQRLIGHAAGRPILVPLSAGLDSRMIASGLVAAGYPHVRTFAYGRAGNREAVISRRIAHRLGLPWTFVPYTNRGIRRIMSSPGHRRYWAQADSLTAIPFPQDFAALSTLKQAGEVPDDAVVVNGQTGDFISGNHIPASLFAPGHGLSPEARLRRIVDGLLAKHFKHWRCLLDAPRLDAVRALLDAEVRRLGDLPDSPLGDHGLLEATEFHNRQAKYVINGQRCYEALGLDWWLPLWDRPALDFWAAAPLAAKRDQTLYREVLTETNWGGVWRDLPINPLRIQPAWMRPVRWLAKAAHAPLPDGRARWRTFETRYLTWFTDPLCSYATWPWWQVATEPRGAASPLAFFHAAYLEARGIDWAGMPPCPRTASEG
ncbi:asparagine synthase family protein [Roseospirillum parvum]|uniref:asparagine synthase (glutamine-hydrolyzing) n=1 Tax=Roseospirillum parvum TaxID=83401 RepID=A0A1G7ZH07_9PROT|nr:asparagine synthetase B family protein [Roseospirillum parvum]SDH08071.1 asparagine synthase (glutamine-hydrolysing) [Roseospirillum parvum]